MGKSQFRVGLVLDMSALSYIYLKMIEVQMKYRFILKVFKVSF